MMTQHYGIPDFAFSRCCAAATVYARFISTIYIAALNVHHRLYFRKLRMESRKYGSCKHHLCPKGRKGCKLCSDLSTHFTRGDEKFWNWKSKTFSKYNFPYLRSRYPGLDEASVFQKIKGVYYDTRSSARFARREATAQDQIIGRGRVNEYLPAPVRRKISSPDPSPDPDMEATIHMADTPIEIQDGIQEVCDIQEEIPEIQGVPLPIPCLRATHLPFQKTKTLFEEPFEFVVSTPVPQIPTLKRSREILERSCELLERSRDDTESIRRMFVEDIANTKKLLLSLEEKWYSWEANHA